MDLSHKQRKGNFRETQFLVISSIFFGFHLTVPTVFISSFCFDNWSAASLTCDIQYARYNKYLAYCDSILGRMQLACIFSFFCIVLSYARVSALFF